MIYNKNTSSASSLYLFTVGYRYSESYSQAIGWALRFALSTFHFSYLLNELEFDLILLL